MKIYLPLFEPDSGVRPESLKGPAPLGTERILVADDDPKVRESVTRTARLGGLPVEILHKPYDPDRLLRAVRRTLDLHRH